MSDETLSQLKRNYNKSELAQEVFKLRAQVKRDEGKDPKIREAGERANQEALEAVTSMSPEDMASQMTTLGVSVNNTLQQVTSGIIQGRNTLADLDRACEAKKGELENLFGQEILARSIGNLLADLDAKKKEAKAAEVELDEQRARSEADESRRQAEWAANFKKDCDRARTEFEWSFGKEKREQKDAFALQLQSERRTFDDEQRARERDWQEREADLAKRQQTISEQEAETEALEANLKAKFEREKHTALGAMKKDHEHAIALATNNANTAAQIASSTIKTQEEQMLKQQAEIEALKRSLVDAQAKNTELAKQALESASGRFALDSVMQHGSNDGKSARGKA